MLQCVVILELSTLFTHNLDIENVTLHRLEAQCALQAVKNEDSRTSGEMTKRPLLDSSVCSDVSPMSLTYSYCDANFFFAERNVWYYRAQ